jgi:SHS family lactate transporter-like MFS transporter
LTYSARLWSVFNERGLALCGSPLMLFLMRAKVQSARGAVPVHLNELLPDNSRGTFPGFVYQLGNLISSVNAILQAAIASH